MNDGTPIKDLPRFVALTQTNGRQTYIRSDLVDLSASSDESFGTRLNIQTSKHPMVAFNGFLDVKETKEDIRGLMDNAMSTLKYLKITDTMDLIDDLSIKANQVDMVVVSNSCSTPIINVFSNDGRLFSQTFINPITNPKNLPEQAMVLSPARPVGPALNRY